MSMMPVSHFTWQVLRTALRSKVPLTGKQLRLTPSRNSKDGTFLDRLVTEGLLEVAGVGDPDEKTGKMPAQFRTRYKLTEKGKYAAEYGEYDKAVQTNEPPPPEEVTKRPKGAKS